LPRVHIHSYYILLMELDFTFCCFLFNDTATTEIYTLSLHDALPIFRLAERESAVTPLLHLAQHEDQQAEDEQVRQEAEEEHAERDRKSTRLNSSHDQNSYAVFCLKKKKHIQ